MAFFSRDADAIIDIIELEVPQKVIDQNADKKDDRGFRIEITTREFLNPETFYIWFSYPLHKFDTTGSLAKLHAAGDIEAKGNKKSADEKRAEEIEKRYEEIASYKQVLELTIPQIAEYLTVDEKTIKRAIAASKGRLKIEDKIKVIVTAKGGQ